MIGIYKITNTITGKNYIGQSGRIENRLASHKKAAYNKKHKQYNDELYQDIRENGIDNFSFEILELISINDIEEKWIQQAVKNNEDFNTAKKNNKLAIILGIEGLSGIGRNNPDRRH